MSGVTSSLLALMGLAFLFALLALASAKLGD
jgi:hypothetical protein